MKLKVTSALLLIAIAIQLLIEGHPYRMGLMTFTAGHGLRSMVELITHMLSHGSWPHLLGNFRFGLPFMIYLESKLGSKRFLLHYALCGLGSCLLMCLMDPGVGMIGSSGATMGAAVGACLSFGTTKKHHLLGLGMVLALFLPQLAAAPTENFTGVAVYGHIGGALTAMLLSSRLLQVDKV